VTPWLALFAPAGVPGPVLARLRTEVNRLLQDPDQIRRLGGLEPYITTPQEFDALLRSEYRKYAEIVKAVGVRID
jgi:tripartite-type tricarboxylate transporter receptor subunit TctC